jgi:glycosyltransferase involved in cell wall biosynthesis
MTRVSETSVPTISCLMVTMARPQRLQPLRRSLAAYCAQTHPRRELIVVHDDGHAADRAAIRRAIDELERDDIRLVTREDQRSLGALRNISWREAQGEYVCQWDDDDLYHPERLARQLDALTGSEAVATCLQHAMQYFPATRRLYLTNWIAAPPGCKPGTLMSRRAIPIAYPEAGPEARLGEDVVVLNQIRRLGDLHVHPDAPHLYVYVSHTHNVCGDAHHTMIADRLAVSRGLLGRREAALREGLAPFAFGPGDVTVEGSNGTGFTIAGHGVWCDADATLADVV